MLRFNKLEFGYGNNPIGFIDGVCNSGELTALTGMNGSGKSTLIKTITGILEPISGNVSIDNNKKNCISYIPQHSDFIRDFPIVVYDFILSAFINEIGFFKGVTKQQKELAFQALETVNLIEKINENISELSGGQFQRMVYARLLLENNDVVLLDEPFSSVDEVTTTLLLKELSKLKQNNKAVLVVLHDCHMINTYFDSEILLEKGIANFNKVIGVNC